MYWILSSILINKCREFKGRDSWERRIKHTVSEDRSHKTKSHYVDYWMNCDSSISRLCIGSIIICLHVHGKYSGKLQTKLLMVAGYL